ncbi:hypothetical protein COL70_17310 [Bacillus pseudomycoides]|uniref:hypothetical protein n=1 Tax=Bacillus pseudomycoides TaxID=64104 RepID=UPI000BF6D49F|nr:hypothetical protein [Bacillus pseudomycoides]PFZ89509.1 hypothetical protein COL70_17310 [Bacillus pseudomycoides]
MKVKEVLDRLNDGTKAVDLAKELNVNDKRLRQVLNGLGFSYNTSLRMWGGAEVTSKYFDKSIFDYVPPKGNRGVKPKSRSNSKKVTKTPQVTSQESEICSSKSNAEGEKDFTSEQILALKEIANQFIHEQANETNRDRLHKRIIKLPNEDMTRKTVVINKAIGDRLDAFASKMKFNKSDILSLALLDFLDHYEKEDE